MEYLAHIADDGRVQTVSEHLHGTGELAAGFAAPFGASDEARAAGLLHDIGKYSAAFQQRIRGSAVSVDHSTAGAQEALKRGDLPAALAIAGHHGGIPDCGNQRHDTADYTTLHGRLRRKLPSYDKWQSEIVLPSAKSPAWAVSDSITAAFYTRMLYSCLVDADFQDTQNFMDGQAAPRGGGESISALLEKVQIPKARLHSSAMQRFAPAWSAARSGSKVCIRLPCPPAAAKPSLLWHLRWNTRQRTACHA